MLPTLIPQLLRSSGPFASASLVGRPAGAYHGVQLSLSILTPRSHEKKTQMLTQGSISTTKEQYFSIWL